MHVWKSKLDNKYDVNVTRTGERTGLFRVVLDEAVLYEKEVSLSYGAIFGADMSDIQYWCDLGVAFVDSNPTLSA